MCEIVAEDIKRCRSVRRLVCLPLLASDVSMRERKRMNEPVEETGGKKKPRP